MAVIIFHRSVDEQCGYASAGGEHSGTVMMYPCKTARFGSSPDISHPVRRQRKNMRIRQPCDGGNLAISYAVKTGTGANKNRAVAVLDEAGDEFGFEQVRAKFRAGLAGRKIEDSGVSSDPETTASVGQDRAHRIAGGFDSQQEVAKRFA